MGSKNYFLDGVQVPDTKGFEGGGAAHCKAYRLSAVCCAKMAVPIEIVFGMLNLVCPGNHVLDGGAHWRYLANTSEPSVFNGDAALCQITLTR